MSVVTVDKGHDSEDNHVLIREVTCVQYYIDTIGGCSAMENIWKIQKTAGAWLLQATTLNNVTNRRDYIIYDRGFLGEHISSRHIRT